MCVSVVSKLCNELLIHVIGIYERRGGVDLFFFFFQAEDGIRDLVRSRGLGDVYKRQLLLPEADLQDSPRRAGAADGSRAADPARGAVYGLSLIHI